MSNGGVRHDCKASGVCFNDAHRLKFGVFEDCWRRFFNGKWEKHNMRPSDVDFIIERRGNILMMEWKATSSVFNLTSGQGIMFRTIPQVAPATVILCEGDASDMVVRKISVLWRGYVSGAMPATQYNLRQILHSWSINAEKYPQDMLYTEKHAPSWMPVFKDEPALTSTTA